MSSDGKRVYVDTLWHSRRVILSVDLAAGKVVNVTPDEAFGEWQFLASRGDYILAIRSSPSVRTHFVVGRVAASGDVSWTPLEALHEDATIKWEILKFRPRLHPEYFFEALYIRKANKKHPLVVRPHGGPHAANTAGYLTPIQFFLKCGYGVLLVNYRGSLGFGEKNLYALPGNVGDFDVKDVQQAAEEVVAKGEVEKVLLFGGSHGGFLAAHLVGQFPSFYTAAAILNPVIDLSMLGPSDIPDWYWLEGGCSGEFKHDSLPNDEDLANLRKRSPIAHAHKITAPCHFFLGTGDLRVDKGQGLKLYKHLKGRGVPAKCNMYEDNHSISKIPHDGDLEVNTMLWFDQHVKH